MSSTLFLIHAIAQKQMITNIRTLNDKRKKAGVFLTAKLQLTSGRNWISSPRCCFSHGIILNRSIWKSRALGGGFLLLYLPRAKLGLDVSHTSVIPQLKTPTLEKRAARSHAAHLPLKKIWEKGWPESNASFVAETGLPLSHLCRQRSRQSCHAYTL